MDLGLKNKVAFVAGGSQGLGKAVALELAREGAKVAICGLEDKSLPEAKAEIARESGVEVFTVAADLTDAAQAKDCIRRTIDRFGSVDILVNNAGGPPGVSFLEIDDQLWEYGFRLNLLSTIILTREVLPLMKQKQWGRIINMTSIWRTSPKCGGVAAWWLRGCSI